MGHMPKRYFELLDDMSIPGRWLLGTPTDLQGREVGDVWAFTDGTPIADPGRLKVPLDVPGRLLDFSQAAFSTPVVHPRVAAVFSELAPEDVQLLPVEIEGQPEPFFILVATKLIRCIDERASRLARKWTPEDGRPEKLGEYRDVRGMRVDPLHIGDAKVFRPSGWVVALIVREELKDALDQMGATGTRFKEV